MPLTPEQIQQMDSITGMGDEAAPPAPVASAGTLTPEQIAKMDEITGAGSLGERITSRYDRSADEADQVVKNPELNLAGRLASGVSVGAKLGHGIIAETADSLIPDAVKEAAGAGVDLIRRGAAHLPGMESYHKAWSDTEQAYPEFEKKNPNTAAVLNMGGNVAQLAGDIAGVDGLMNVGRAAVNKASDLSSNGLPKKAPAAPKFQGKSADLKKLAGEGYDEAAWSGESFSPEHVSNKFMQAMNSVKPKPIAGAVVPSENTAFLKDIGEFEGLAGRKMSLNDVTELDQNITMKINKYVDAKTGLPDANGRRLIQLQDDLRDLVDNSPGGDVIKSARTLWAAQRRLKDVEDIIERASLTQIPGTSMQNGFRNLYMNQKRMRGWSQREKLLIKKAAETGITDDLLGVMGSRLNVIAQAAAGGGLGGTAAAAITGMAGRGLRTKVIAGRAQKLGDEIVNRALGESDLPRRAAPEYPAQRLLAAPGKLSPLPMTEREIAIARKQIEQKPVAGQDTSGSAIAPAPTKLLPAPENMGKLPEEGLAADEISRAQAQVKKAAGETGGVQVTEPPSGSTTIRPPVSQIEKLQGSLRGIKRGQLRNMQDHLLSGKLSQNKFVEMSKKSFGLNNKEALDLARETLKYKGKK